MPVVYSDKNRLAREQSLENVTPPLAPAPLKEKPTLPEVLYEAWKRFHRTHGPDWNGLTPKAKTEWYALALAANRHRRRR